jgi:hypothetical protein
MKPIDFLQKAFEARDVIHFAHWNTTSYSQHKALGKFYDGWIDLVDTFIETYTGVYGRVLGEINIDFNNDIDCTKYLVELRGVVREANTTIIVPSIDKDLENILADMTGLINHTLYLLTLK